MKYPVFKKSVYSILMNTYNFKMKDKVCQFDTDEVIILFKVVKSNFANDAYIRIGYQLSTY